MKVTRPALGSAIEGRFSEIVVESVSGRATIVTCMPFSNARREIESGKREETSGAGAGGLLQRASSDGSRTRGGSGNGTRLAAQAAPNPKQSATPGARALGRNAGRPGRISVEPLRPSTSRPRRGKPGH
jgi:hypothetical protein